jgi:Cu-processing system permease protein
VRARTPFRPGRAMVVAREEYRRAIESRWLFGFAALFAVFVLGLSFFGLAQSGEVGFTGFARVTLSLLNLVLFVVPLVGLLLGVTSVTGSADSLSMLLAQPISRAEVLVGKFAGVTAAIAAAQLLGLGGGGLVVAINAGPDQLGGFAVLCAASLALAVLSVATALAIASVWPDRLKATGAALALWLLLVVAYDLGVLGATTMFRGVGLQAVLLPALLLNPVDLARVLVTMAVGRGALFGPTAAVLARTLGTAPGIAVAMAALALQTALPLAVALRVFRRRDW